MTLDDGAVDEYEVSIISVLGLIRAAQPCQSFKISAFVRRN